MIQDHFRAEKEMLIRSQAISLPSLKNREHFVSGFISWVNFQYSLEQRECSLILCRIEELHFTFQSCCVVRRETQRAVKGIQRVMVAALDRKYNPFQCPKTEVVGRLVQGGSSEL